MDGVKCTGNYGRYGLNQNLLLKIMKKDYYKWYNEIITKADLAENSVIRGCMIIKPYGLSIWEKIKINLNEMLKNSGHENIYFPLFIPKSYFSKESNHIKGFAKECAVVTHYRLKKSLNDIIVDPDSKLKEELIIRPTSETIIWDSYRRWIRSYRDLPLLLNQWSNVVRWEMRTRFFLRSSEFLWQEGHTAHCNKKEAIEETKEILNIYVNFMKNFMAMPVIIGKKTINERFCGASETYCIEAIMQDGKSLQIATSHFLGQNFSKAFDVKFTDKNGNINYVWSTSWGTSTRLIGSLILTHSDDYGLILPPKLAPIQVIILPVYKNEKEKIIVKKYSLKIIDILKKQNIDIKFDERNNKSLGKNL
jgi:prolyl-tRNA synthetase